MVEYVPEEEVKFLIKQYITILCTIQLMCKRLSEKTNHIYEAELYQLHTTKNGIMECMYYHTLIRETIVHFLPLVGVPSVDMKRAIYNPNIAVKTRSLDQATFWRVLDRGDLTPSMTRTRFVSVQMIIERFREMMYAEPYLQNMYARKFQLGSSSLMVTTHITNIRKDRQYVSLLADALTPLLSRGYTSDPLPKGFHDFISGPRLLRKANSKSRFRSRVELEKIKTLSSQSIRKRSYQYAMRMVKSKGAIEVLVLNTPYVPPTIARAETGEEVPTPRPHCSSDMMQTDSDQPITAPLQSTTTIQTSDMNSTVSTPSALYTVDNGQTAMDNNGQTAMDNNGQAAIDNVMDKHFEQLSEILPQTVLEEYFM